MNESEKDTGLAEVLLERLEQQHLPRLLALKDKLDAGESLDKYDLDYLQQAIHDARNIIPLIDRHEEYQPLAAQVMEFYKDITDKAMALEKKA